MKRRPFLPEFNDYELRYWEKIHELNRTNPVAELSAPEPNPVKEYIIRTIELMQTDE